MGRVQCVVRRIFVVFSFLLLDLDLDLDLDLPLSNTFNWHRILLSFVSIGSLFYFQVNILFPALSKKQIILLFKDCKP